MPAIPEFVKLQLIQATPAAVGEVAISAGGQLLLHNGTSVDTYTPGGGSGTSKNYATRTFARASFR